MMMLSLDRVTGRDVRPPGALPLGDHRARGDQPSHLVRQERLVELTPAAQDRRWAVLTSSGLMLEQHGYREL